MFEVKKELIKSKKSNGKKVSLWKAWFSRPNGEKGVRYEMTEVVDGENHVNRIGGGLSFLQLMYDDS